MALLGNNKLIVLIALTLVIICLPEFYASRKSVSSILYKIEDTAEVEEIKENEEDDSKPEEELDSSSFMTDEEAEIEAEELLRRINE